MNTMQEQLKHVKTNPQPVQMSVQDVIKDSAMYEPETYGQVDFDKNFLLQIRKDTAESIAFRVFGALRAANNELSMRRPDLDLAEQHRENAKAWAYQLKAYVQDYFEFKDLNNLIEKIGNSVINSMEAPRQQTSRGMTRVEWKDLEPDERKEALKPYKKLGISKPVARELIMYGVPFDLIEQYVNAKLDLRDLIRMEKQVLQRQLKQDAARRQAAEAIEEEFFQILFDVPEHGPHTQFDREVEEIVVSRIDQLETRLQSPRTQASARIKGWEDKLDEAIKVVNYWQNALELEHDRIAREQTEHEAEGYATQEGGVH